MPQGIGNAGNTELKRRLVKMEKGDVVTKRLESQDILEEKRVCGDEKINQKKEISKACVTRNRGLWK